MTPNKPIGTAKVELPEMWDAKWLKVMTGSANSEDAPKLRDHIRALQAYIQQPSPLVLAPSIGATDARAGEAKGNSEGTEPGIPSPLVEENRRLKELLRRARVQLNYAAGALPVNAHRSGLDKVVAAIKAALAQPETKGER